MDISLPSEFSPPHTNERVDEIVTQVIYWTAHDMGVHQMKRLSRHPAHIHNFLGAGDEIRVRVNADDFCTSVNEEIKSRLISLRRQCETLKVQIPSCTKVMISVLGPEVAITLCRSVTDQYIVTTTTPILRRKWYHA